MTTRKHSAEDVIYAKTYLAKHVTPESDIYFLQRHSKTGARRYLRVFIVSDGQILCVTNTVARACGFRLDSANQEIVIDGGGFSATFEVADSLSRALFGKGGMLRETAM